MPWLVSLVCAPAEPAVSAIAAPINAARQCSSMVFPRGWRRREAGMSVRNLVARLMRSILAQADRTGNSVGPGIADFGDRGYPAGGGRSLTSLSFHGNDAMNTLALGQ